MNTKILLVTPYSFKHYGGVQNQVNLLNTSINKIKKYESKIFAPDTKEFSFSKTIKIKFNSSISTIGFFPNRKSLLKAFEWADIIHIHEPFIPIFFWRLPKNKKYIVTHHANISKIYLIFMKFLYIFKNLSCISTHVSPLALSNALSLSKYSTLIPNAIEINPEITFNFNRSFLFIGRNEKRKNLDLFIKLSSTYESNYKYNAITNENLTIDNINVYNQPNDQERNNILRKSGIYLSLNTKSESFGITIIEAINNGCLVVSSNLPSSKYVLENSGIYFENNSIYSLIEVLDNLKDEELPKLWKYQFEQIQKFNIKNIIKMYLSIYKHF